MGITRGFHERKIEIIAEYEIENNDKHDVKLLLKKNFAFQYEFLN